MNMKDELTLWRFGVAVLGGRWSVIATGCAFVFGLGGAVYAVLNPYHQIRVSSVNMMVAGMFASVAFCGLALAAAQLANRQRMIALVRLAPGYELRRRALLMRVGWLLAVALAPALIIRVLLGMKDAYDADPVVFLANAPLRDWLLWAAFLIHLGGLVFVLLGPLKLPLNVAVAPVYFGAMAPSTRTWWWLLAFSVAVVVCRWVWTRINAGLDGRAADVRSGDSATHRAWRVSIERWRKRRLKAATRTATNEQSTGVRRATALLATQTFPVITFMTVCMVAWLTLRVPPGAHVSSWFLWYMAATAVSLPMPMPLSRTWLPPLAVRRRELGLIVVSVRMRHIRWRIAAGILIGMGLRAWVLSGSAPAFLSFPRLGPETDLMTNAAWVSLLGGACLHGIAYAFCVLQCAWPTLVERRGGWVTAAFFSTLVLAAASVALARTIGPMLPSLGGANEMLVGFALVHAVLLPLCAWALMRSTQWRWRRANLASVSQSMNQWAAAWHKAGFFR